MADTTLTVPFLDNFNDIEFIFQVMRHREFCTMTSQFVSAYVCCYVHYISILKSIVFIHVKNAFSHFTFLMLIYVLSEKKKSCKEVTRSTVNTFCITMYLQSITHHVGILHLKLPLHSHLLYLDEKKTSLKHICS